LLTFDHADKQVFCWAPATVKFPFVLCCLSACAPWQQRAARSCSSCNKATALIGLITLIKPLGFYISSQQPQGHRRASSDTAEWALLL